MPLSTSTDYIAWLVHSTNSKSKLLAVLNYTGYFDESGTDVNSRVIVVGGYVSPAQDWRRLEIKWHKILNRAIPKEPRYYHTTDAQANPPRGIYRGWSREKADRMTDRLIPLLKDHVRWGLAICLLREDWLSVLEIAKRVFPKPKEVDKFPYIVLSKMCIEGLVSILGDKLPREEKIGFVFERNNLSGVLVKGYEILEKNPKYARRFRGFYIGQHKEDFPGLQAADLFVWHYRRFAEHKVGYRSGEISDATKKVLLPNVDLCIVKRAALRRELEECLTSAIGRPFTGFFPRGDN